MTDIVEKRRWAGARELMSLQLAHCEKRIQLASDIINNVTRTALLPKIRRLFQHNPPKQISARWLREGRWRYRPTVPFWYKAAARRIAASASIPQDRGA